MALFGGLQRIVREAVIGQADKDTASAILTQIQAGVAELPIH
jgi:hypothetical protein